MSPFMEKIFHVLAFLGQGPSYLSAYAYGAMHRMHHAYADTPLDPHSPKYDKNIWAMMLKTAKTYDGILRRNVPVDPRFTQELPDWRQFDRICSTRSMRIAFGAIYVGIYFLLGVPWYGFIFLPIHWLMGPIHGAIINWGAHKYGYRNFRLNNTSTNLMPVNLVMMGEGLHNNHHARPKNPNFAKKWFEFDPTYPIIVLLDKCRIISLPRKSSA